MLVLINETGILPFLPSNLQEFWVLFPWNNSRALGMWLITCRRLGYPFVCGEKLKLYCKALAVMFTWLCHFVSQLSGCVTEMGLFFFFRVA